VEYGTVEGLSVEDENSSSGNLHFGLLADDEFGVLEVYFDFGGAEPQREAAFVEHNRL